MQTAIKLGATDRFMLKLESRDTPAHTASLSIFSVPEGAPRDFMQQLFATLCTQPITAPPFNYVLASRRSPAWQPLDSGDIDTDYHVRHSALPWPGGERELGKLVSRLHAHQLDFARPLWEFHLIEGLERGRFATYMKMHHALADGGAVIRILTESLATTPDEAPRAPWARPVAAAHRQAAPAESPPDQAGTRKLLQALARVAVSARERPESGFVGPYVGPKSVLNTRITAARRYATQQLSLDRLKTIGKATGASVNDVFLAIVAGALRRYLQEIDALPERSLVTCVPAAVERATEDGLGNALTVIYATLATNVPDPLERLHIIRDSMAQGKAFVAQLSPQQVRVLNALVFIPAAMLNAIGGTPNRPTANLTISNVPGPRHPLWLGRAACEALYPCSMIVQAAGLNITARGYLDRINIGMVGARDALPHLQHLAVYTADALDELERTQGAA